MTYEKRIANLVATHLDTEAPLDITALLAVLGCRHTLYAVGPDPILITPVEPDPHHEPLVLATLLQITRMASSLKSGDAFGLLDGLLKHHRWRACLDCAECSFEFAVLIDSFFRTMHYTAADENLSELIAVSLFDAANEWLKPQQPFVPYDTRNFSGEIESLLFGEVWCDLALGGLTGHPEEALTIIRAQRPPLQPGLLPAYSLVSATPLPPLETP